MALEETTLRLRLSSILWALKTMTTAAPKLDPKAPGKLRRAWNRLRGGEITPARAFWSVAIGVFVGVQPTPGVHVFIVLGVCVPLRLDAALSYLAANISIPPVAPFLWFASFQVGSRILFGHFAALSVEDARALVHAPGSMLGALAIGSVVFGAGLASVFGSLAYVLARMRGARVVSPESAYGDAIARTAQRYARATKRRASLHYVRAKLLRDPCTRAIFDRAPLGDVLDLGCGRGQLALFLLESGAATSVLGCEWDATKLDLARRAADGLEARFTCGDVRDAEVQPADTVLLVDVLHYFSIPEQDALLTRAARLVRPGGRLLVREASAGHGVRSFLTQLFERIGRALRINRGERLVFRDVARAFVPVLEASGMVCAVEPCWEGTPLSNVLLIARAPERGR